MHVQSSPTRLIPLTQGLWTLVDATDYPALSALTWHASRHARAFYATHAVWNGKNASTIHMHRLILGLPPGRAPMVDHINGDALDNRRANLRLATRAQNAHNSGPRPSNRSGYKGVLLLRRTGRWKATLKLGDHSNHLGYFDSAEEAARAYDRAAVILHGEFARLNFP